MTPEELAPVLFSVSIAVSAIAVLCDFKWRKYPNWAFYSSLGMIAFTWYWFFRSQGWLADFNPVVVTYAIVLLFAYLIGASIGNALYSTGKFGGGDAKFMGVMSLLALGAHKWVRGPTIFPRTGGVVLVDFWANTVLAWVVFTLIVMLAGRLWRASQEHVIPLTPPIVAIFYVTVLTGGFWRNVIEPIIHVILGG